MTITRLRDGLTLIVDNADRLERAVERTPGLKTSALETLGRLGRAATKTPATEPQGENDKPRDQAQLERSKSKPFDFGL